MFCTLYISVEGGDDDWLFILGWTVPLNSVVWLPRLPSSATDTAVSLGRLCTMDANRPSVFEWFCWTFCPAVVLKSLDRRSLFRSSWFTRWSWLLCCHGEGKGWWVMIDDLEVDLTLFTRRCKASWPPPPTGTVQQQPKPEHLSARMVCVHVCVRVWQGGPRWWCVFGRVA